VLPHPQIPQGRGKRGVKKLVRAVTATSSNRSQQLKLFEFLWPVSSFSSPLVWVLEIASSSPFRKALELPGLRDIRFSSLPH